MKPLLCLRHQATAPLGILQEVLDEERVEWRYVDCWATEELPEANEFSGLIVLGGEMNADDTRRYPYLSPLRDLVREAVLRDQPVLGICLGVQILARAFGAPVYPAPQREIGFVEVEATPAGRDDLLLEPFGSRTRLFQFHEDACDLPEGAELLYTNDSVAVQAFRIGEKAYGTQFHFEVTETEIREWCDETPDLEESWGASKTELLEQAKGYLEDQQKAGKEVARRFLSLLG
jgi:GMP synthase (glutamine-hydrolysing)